MTAPLFKLPTLAHISTKHRKDFIIDAVFAGVGCSILYVSLNETFSEGVKQLHKNKDRKQVAKIKEVLSAYKKQRDLIHAMLSKKDLLTIQAKTEKIAPEFIKAIAMSKDDMCLEYIAISILKQGLTRDRKTPLHDLMRPFASFMVHNKVIKNVKMAKGYDYAKEWEVSKKFCEKVRY